jgi:hypothetical protein
VLPPVFIDNLPIQSSRAPRTSDRSTSIVAPAGTAMSGNWAKPTAVREEVQVDVPEVETGPPPDVQPAAIRSAPPTIRAWGRILLSGAILSIPENTTGYRMCEYRLIRACRELFRHVAMIPVALTTYCHAQSPGHHLYVDS